MYNPKVSATSSRSFVGELLKHIPCNVENHEACWGKVVSPKKASPKRVSEDRLTFNITAVIKRTHQACYQILSSCSLKRWTYPFKSMKRICGCVEIYSTVGVRVPICRLTMLLNKWTTSFFPLTKKKEKKKHSDGWMTDWVLMICRDIFAWGTGAYTLTLTICYTKWSILFACIKWNKNIHPTSKSIRCRFAMRAMRRLVL